MVVRENNHLIRELIESIYNESWGSEDFAWISKFYKYKISLTGLETWNNKIGKNG